MRLVVEARTADHEGVNNANSLTTLISVMCLSTLLVIQSREECKKRDCSLQHGTVVRPL